MSPKLMTVQYHTGNPNLCRIPELRIRAMPECEGGGYSIPREQAELIVRAVNALIDTSPEVNEPH